MPDRIEGHRLLRLAHRDLQALRSTVAVPDYPDTAFGFFAQQAVEKALKAWLALVDVRYPYTHDLVELGRALRQAGADPSSFVALFRFLPYGVQMRYDEDFSDSTPAIDRAAAVEELRVLVEHVADLLRRCEEIDDGGPDMS